MCFNVFFQSVLVRFVRVLLRVFRMSSFGCSVAAVTSTSASDWLERLFFDTLNPTHSLTHSYTGYGHRS